jgi:anti-sigma B factor antagonist
MSATTPERGRRGGATLTVEEIDGAAVLRVGGELDLLTVPDLQARVYEAIAATSGAVVADLTEVQFLSSSGLTLLLGLQSDLAARDRPLRLVVGGSKAVSRPLLITGLDRLLELHPDLDAALDACHP